MKNSLRIRWPALVVPICLAAGWVNHSRADAPEGRYVIANGTVFDTQSNLTWEQNAPFDLHTWEQAQLRCQDLDLDGFGWRAPSVKELQTLVDETRVDPSIDPTPFPFTALTRYWTSTVRASNTAQAWLVSFARGSTVLEDVKNVHPVRCVR